MKFIYLILLISIFSSCNEEPISPVDHCPTCSSITTINGSTWPTKPNYATFRIKDQDTTFILELIETNPQHDNFYDALLFKKIPFKLGEFQFTSTGTDVQFFIFEVEHGTATQVYWPTYDGTGSIIVQSLNKTTGVFSLIFDIVVFPNGNPSFASQNSTYSNRIEISGSATGRIESE